MLKFFRKYSKWILAIGGSLLMIVFLLPQAVEQFGGGSGNRTLARFDGGKITILDNEAAMQELRIISQMGLDGLGLIRAQPADMDRYMAEHWILLTTMAERAGLVGGPADGRDFLAYASLFMARAYVEFQLGPDDPSSEELVNLIAPRFREELEDARSFAIVNSGLPEDQFDRVLAKARGVLRMYELYFEAPALSDLEAMRVARGFLDQAAINHVIIRATRIVPEAPFPTEAQINEFFDRYRAVERGQGEYSLGYLHRPAVKLEWLHIERQRIQRGVTIDPIDANAHWRRNRDNYPADWAVAREQVIEDLRAREADEVMREIDRLITAELRRSTMQLADDGPYKALPEDWDLIRPSLNALGLMVQGQVKERFGIEMRQPIVVELTRGWNIRDEFSRFAGFNESVLRMGPRGVTPEEAAFSMREFGEDSPFNMQAGLVYGPATNPDTGDVFYFRITDVRRQEPPASVEEVRSLVTSDVHRFNAYQMLLDSAPDILRMFEEGGFLAVQERFGIREVDRDVAVSRTDMRPLQTRDINIQSVRDAVIDKAMTIDPTRQARELPIADRTMVLPLPQAMAVALVEITDVRPLTQELYRLREPRASANARGDLFSIEIADWPFSWTAVRDRMGYRDLVQRGDHGAIDVDEEDPA